MTSQAGAPGQYIYEGMTMTQYYPAESLDKIKVFEYRNDDIFVVTYPKAGKSYHYCDVIMGFSTVYSGTDKKTSKLRVTGLCEGNSLVTGAFPAQRASNKENVSVWWRHHDLKLGGCQGKWRQFRHQVHTRFFRGTARALHDTWIYFKYRKWYLFFTPSF